MRVLLVAPPFRTPNEGTLSVATLRPLFEAWGATVDELHGSLFYNAPGTDGSPELYDWNSRFAFTSCISELDRDKFIDRALAHTLSTLDPRAIIADPSAPWPALFGMDEAAMRADLAVKMAHARACVEKMAAAALAKGRFDLVGISATFIDQLPAGIALTRQLKRAWPDTCFGFGGAACQAEQADGLLASFPEIDFVCHTEAEAVIGPLADAVQRRSSLAAVPGIAYRDEGGAVRHNDPPPLLRNLDELPVPDYRAFVADLAVSGWTGRGADLFFETSRGCWWGEKSLCTFCGLNGDGLAFRAKSGDRAYAEIVALHDDYPTANTLRAADNILEHKYFETLLPRLESRARAADRPLRMFFEVKSNMRADQVEGLVAGGVTHVQPGIESFSDGMLKLMRKGSTALGQVQYVKWSQQAGLMVSYNILVLNPGERTDWYWEMVDLVPFLRHLSPPASVSTVLLERFSPYFLNPSEFGIRDVRPKPFFFAVFGESADPRLCYEFDFEHPMFDDHAHIAAVRAFATAIRQWQADWRPDQGYYLDLGGRLAIVDARDGVETRTEIAGVAARIFLYLDKHHTRQMIAGAFPDVDPVVLDGLLAAWLHRRWICRQGERYLAVMPRKGPARTAAAPSPRRESVRLPLAAAP